MTNYWQFFKSWFCDPSPETPKPSKPSKPSEPSKIVIFYSTLTIYANRNHSWSCDIENEKSYRKPWLDFYKWYFKKDRKPYDSFVMRCVEGDEMILRSGIKSFTVIVNKKYV